MSSSSTVCADLDSAAVFYALASKRMGLVRPGLLAIQCLLLSGMYHMYILQPVEAWTFFMQACERFWLHKKSADHILDFRKYREFFVAAIKRTI
jgi:hypothetical protein